MNFELAPLEGEALHPVLWMGKQWAITTYGLECKNGQYHIKAGRQFWDKGLKPIEVYDRWHQHLTQKTWVDKEDIEDALHIMFILFDENGERTEVPAFYPDKQ
jgi:hypothetical protein